jgi:hypothetical protein
MDRRILELKEMYEKQIKEIDDCVYLPERWSLFGRLTTKNDLKVEVLQELRNNLYKLI